MAYVRMVEGMALAGMTDSGHMVPMDTNRGVGGLESAAAPMELVLQALMGCTAMDVISILKKMKIENYDLRITEEHERAKEHPKVYIKIHMKYLFHGNDIDPEKVKKAVTLSKERYCGVTAMLGKTAEITHDIMINDERIR